MYIEKILRVVTYVYSICSASCSYGCVHQVAAPVEDTVSLQSSPKTRKFRPFFIARYVEVEHCLFYQNILQELINAMSWNIQCSCKLDVRRKMYLHSIIYRTLNYLFSLIKDSLLRPAGHSSCVFCVVPYLSSTICRRHFTSFSSALNLFWTSSDS